jgi:hypothetical protein
VELSGNVFAIGLILAIIGFYVLLFWIIDITEYIIGGYGIYIFAGFFLVLSLLGGISNYGDETYFIQRNPYMLTFGFLVLLLLPLFAKESYPSLDTKGGLIYYTFLLFPGILLTSDLFKLMIKKLKK